MKFSANLILLICIFTVCACRQGDNKTTNSEKNLGNSEVEPPVYSENTTENCLFTNEEEKLKSELFPFTFKSYSTNTLMKFFDKNTMVDSIKKSKEGSDYMIYTFKNGSSHISFFVKPPDGSDTWFYLDNGSIDNNFIALKNGLKIGMERKEVTRILNIKAITCDTLHVQEGDLFTYYDFIFKNDKLDKIEIMFSE